MISRVEITDSNYTEIIYVPCILGLCDKGKTISRKWATNYLDNDKYVS